MSTCLPERLSLGVNKDKNGLESYFAKGPAEDNDFCVCVGVMKEVELSSKKTYRSFLACCFDEKEKYIGI